MPFFKVEITESLKRVVIIEADSKDEAYEEVEGTYLDGEEIILTDSDYYGDFEIEVEETTEKQFLERKAGGTQVVEIIKA